MPDSSNSTLARRLGIALTAPGLLFALAACGNSGSATPVAGTTKAPAPSAQGASGQGTSSQGTGSSQAPVAAESNPPGDIPDTTVYVTYQSPQGHLLIKVPEGWSRKTTPASATFTSNLNSISVAWMPMAAPPTVRSVQATTVPALKAKALAFRLQSVRAVKLAGGPAVETIYQANSPPNGVTGRQYRLVIERFELYRHGQAAVIDLSSAVGSDNVDPWRIVSESFRWK
jgi:hypothetical protein